MPESFDTPYNVVAAFPRESSAATAVQVLEHDGVPESAIEVHHNPDDAEAVAELRAEMQEELAESWGGPAFYMTEDQAKGASWATLAFVVPGVVLGALVGLVWAFVDSALLNWWGEILVGAILGGMAGGTIGLLAGGGLKPRKDGTEDLGRAYDDRRAVAERDVLVAVHAERREVAERAAEVLRSVGAERVDLVDRSGTPLPPQSGSPRPADPEGYWWHQGEGR